MSYTSALVVQKDSTIYKNSDGTFGQLMLVPTPSSGGKVDSDYWLTPVIDSGIVGTGFIPQICQALDVNKPDPQSFHAVRIIVYTQDQSTAWWAVGNSTQYILASNDAESNAPSSPPVTMPQTLAAFVPEQVICNQNANGLYFGILAAPTLGTGKYFVKGYYNDSALPAASGAGYASASALLTFLNTAVTGWASVGTWTKTADNLTFIVTQSAGSGTDTLAAAITVI